MWYTLTSASIIREHGDIIHRLYHPLLIFLCRVLSALTVIAEQPELIKNIVLTKKVGLQLMVST